MVYKTDDKVVITTIKFDTSVGKIEAETIMI